MTIIYKSQLSIGTLKGALIAGPVADRIGRKWSISAWCIVLHIGLIVQNSAPELKWYQSRQNILEKYRTKLTFLVVVVGRWIAGLGVGALSLLVPSMPLIYFTGQILNILVLCFYRLSPPEMLRRRERVVSCVQNRWILFEQEILNLITSSVSKRERTTSDKRRTY